MPIATTYLTSVLGTVLGRIRSERGQTMAEYGILIAVIALVVIVVAITLGGTISSLFGSASNQL